jgi:hypothetical protein
VIKHIALTGPETAMVSGFFISGILRGIFMEHSFKGQWITDSKGDKIA